MKKVVTSTLIISLIINACADPRSDEKDKTVDTTTRVNTPGTAEDSLSLIQGPRDQVGGNSGRGDSLFVMKAAMGNTAEVDAGKLAMQKSTNRDVKNFASMMIKDHTDAQSKLKGIASPLNMNVPDSMDAEHKSLKQRLSNLSGANFDREYMNAQVADHRATIALFEQQSTGGSDTALKRYAASTLPHLRMHLERAESIVAKLK